MAPLRVIHLRTQGASEILLTGVARAGERQNSAEDPSEPCLRGVPLLRVNHLRTQNTSKVLLRGVTRAGERQNSTKNLLKLYLKQITFLHVNHLRTQGASQVLLKGVTRAGEGLMVSPAHSMCPTGTSEGGNPRW